MARTVIPIQTLPAHGGVDNAVTRTAGDATNDMYFLNTGRELLIMVSTSAGAKAATVVSVADQFGRTGDTSMAPDGEDVIAIAGPFKPTIWNQAGGLVHVDLTDDTDTEFAVVRMPADGVGI